MMAEANGRKTLFLDADEFNCSVAVANLAVELCRLYGQDEPETFLGPAMDLICDARNVIEERKL
jgi:hypothetical protein